MGCQVLAEESDAKCLWSLGDRRSISWSFFPANKEVSQKQASLGFDRVPKTSWSSEGKKKRGQWWYSRYYRGTLISGWEIPEGRNFRRYFAPTHTPPVGNPTRSGPCWNLVSNEILPAALRSVHSAQFSFPPLPPRPLHWGPAGADWDSRPVRPNQWFCWNSLKVLVSLGSSPVASTLPMGT